MYTDLGFTWSPPAQQLPEIVVTADRPPVPWGWVAVAVLAWLLLRKG